MNTTFPNVLYYLTDIQNFKPDEFLRCNPSCHITDVDFDSLKRLDNARDILGEPIVLNCAYRSVVHEKKQGRSGSSSHCKGVAFDIRTPSHQYRMRLVAALIMAGFRRIGIYETFVHVDTDTDKPQTMWLLDKQI